jgi:nitrate/nitrite transporter NarK
METLPPPQPGAYIPGKTPGVIIWYRVYLVLINLLFLFVAGLGAAVTFGWIPVTADDLDGMPPELMGGIYLVLGVAMMIPFVVALFLPRKPWVWVYHMVMICIGMTGCTIVASVPLLIFWLKPDVKGYFGKPY